MGHAAHNQPVVAAKGAERSSLIFNGELAAIRNPLPTGLRGVAILVGVGRVWNGVDPTQPAGEINIGAAARAERPIGMRGRRAADGATFSHTSLGPATIHRLGVLPRLTQSRSVSAAFTHV
jgi:hypothetical protein